MELRNGSLNNAGIFFSLCSASSEKLSPGHPWMGTGRPGQGGWSPGFSPAVLLTVLGSQAPSKPGGHPNSWLGPCQPNPGASESALWAALPSCWLSCCLLRCSTRKSPPAGAPCSPQSAPGGCLKSLGRAKCCAPSGSPVPTAQPGQEVQAPARCLRSWGPSRVTATPGAASVKQD